MENVPEVIGTANLQDFLKWTKALEELGYQNYFEIMNAKHYGLPQNRRRVFMISVLGDYSYSFPIKVKLKHRLKDFLETNVEEKYYLSKKMIDYIRADNEKWTGNNGDATINKGIACTINTAPGQRRCDASNYIADGLPENYDLKSPQKRISEPTEEPQPIDYRYDEGVRGRIDKNVSPTITTKTSGFSGIPLIMSKSEPRLKGLPIVENNKDGYKIAYEGDGINIGGRNKYQRGNVQKDSCQTIKTSPDIGVLSDLRIRKLTPLECMKLMGFTAKDYQALRDIEMSDSAIYHMAGDSICTTCLIAIFSPLFHNEDEHIKIINNYIRRLL